MPSTRLKILERARWLKIGIPIADKVRYNQVGNAVIDVKDKRMLKSWSIENFKCIVNSGEVKLAPVTVFAGLNSSGKSSFLQSILMISQTLSSRVLDRPLVPNGPIVQLRTFEDILNETTKSHTLTVDFDVGITKEELKLPSIRVPVGRVTFLDNVKKVKILVRFRRPNGTGTSSSAIEASQVIVESVSLRVNFLPLSREQMLVLTGRDIPSTQSIQGTECEMDVTRVSDKELAHFLRGVAPEYRRLVSYADNQDAYFGKLKVYDENLQEKEQGPYLVNLSHFLPSRFLRKFTIKEHLTKDIDFLLRLPRRLSDPKFLREMFPLINLEERIPKDLEEAIASKCRAGNIHQEFTGKTLGDLFSWYATLKVENNSVETIKIMREIQSVVRSFLIKKLESGETDKSLEGLEPESDDMYIGILERAIEQITSLFTSKIRYLGPLRADPQSPQQFSSSSEIDDVGAKGQYAAAVYDANQNARIEWYNPHTRQMERNTLKVALDSWARYLGVAEQIKIEMAGQSGVSWQVVHLKGRKPRPLSAVGVGVSQVLPILVMGLLAPKNTLLIVEQPELHLHPRVQARLGDFFVGLATCNKQCLIETHSENLVSQLRYHIVQAGGQEQSDCLIYFVGQDETGASQFTPVEISPQGNILNWPDGFFDETMLQEDRITSASLKQRAGKAKKR